MPIGAALARRRASAVASAALLLLIGAGAAPAVAATPGPGWTISSVAEPSDFSSADNAACEANGSVQEEEAQGPCDRYRLVIQNVGSTSTNGATITITEALPLGIKAKAVGGEENQAGTQGTALTCELTPEPHCSYPSAVPPGGFFTMEVQITVEPGVEPSVTNDATVEGGGAPTVSTSAPGTESNMVNEPSIPFDFTSFAFGADGLDGAPNLQAGDHPFGLAVDFGVSTFTRLTREPFNGEKEIYEHLPVQDGPKDVAVDLPPGFVGDPQVAAQCSQAQLVKRQCPPASKIGTVVIEETGVFKWTGEESGLISAVYNMIPEAGYPAEFAFRFTGETFAIYANVAHTQQGYTLRAFSPGVVNAELGEVAFTFFGNPGEHDGGPPSSGAFLTNPADCATGHAEATVRADSWGQPDAWIGSNTVAYPRVTGCDLLRFNPTIAVEPEVKQEDTPSGYEVDLMVPQAQQNYAPVLATPDLRDATVTLPVGVSVSPSAGDGLAGCQETGAEGIDIPSGERLPDEAGEGEEMGVDGLARLAKGHCPLASQIGTVEVETPLLPPHTLKGHVYLAQPKCGGEGQPVCTEASATNGELYGIYLEIEGDGVVVKLKGKVEANPQTGQLTTRFEENPQIPFSELKLKLNGGERAPLANPQSCGTFTATSELVPWSGSETPSATPSSAFSITGCAGSPFAPSFSAGTATPSGGAYSEFTLTFSRHDGEQDLSALTVSTPPGLLAKIAGVQQCPEPQASQGACGPGSLIGQDEAAAGAGSHPLWESGSVYLTGPYGGGPFGLSIVTSAKAGPVNLGNVVVRAAIHVDPITGALTVTSDPLPQIIDGVPLRIQTVNVSIDKPEFMFNPTNCDQQTIAGTITSAQGASAGVSRPFAVANCANLPFKPSFTASTQGKTSKANGASLVVKVAQKAGEANIHKVDLALPTVLPSRLTTLQKACTEAQFNANPAGCPEGSFIGTATAVTPVLNVPLTGPAILVSHGGAAFPDVEFILQGEGVEIVLDGRTDIKGGITYSKFETVPDAPISSFETNLPEGPHSVLATNIPANANGSFCGLNLTMPTTIEGQNGAQIKQTTEIAVTGCKPVIAVVKKKRSNAKVLLTLRSTVAGTLTVTGSGVKKAKRAVAVGEQQIQVALTNAGRHRRTIKLEIVLRSGKSTLSKAIRL